MALEQRLSIETAQQDLTIGEVFVVDIFHEVSREETDPNARSLTVRLFFSDDELQLDEIAYPDSRFTQQFAIPGTDENNEDGIDETNVRQTLIFNRTPVPNPPFPEERTLVLQLTFMTLAEFDGTQLSALIPTFPDFQEIITLNLGSESPIANDDQYSVNEDVTLTIDAANGVLGNDTDIDGDNLTSVLVDAPSNGNLTLNTDGSFEYVPNANFNGTDSFTYQANDGELNSEPATVTITVNSVNDTPEAVEDQYSVNENDTLIIEAADGVLGNDTDIDGDNLTVVSNTEPSNGTLNIDSDGGFIYTPFVDFSGEDSFEYTISDGNGGTSTATVTIIVKEPPVFGSLESDTLDVGVTPDFDGGEDLVFSGSGDDFIDTVAGTGNNRLYGQSGNDTFTLGGDDRAFGGSGDDQFFLLGGNNVVTGGDGADQFWIANAEIPESRHTITDFNLEDDLLNIEGLGVGSFSDLTLSNEDGNALIAFDNNELATLLRVNADTLTPDNFGVLS